MLKRRTGAWFPLVLRFHRAAAIQRRFNNHAMRAAALRQLHSLVPHSYVRRRQRDDFSIVRRTANKLRQLAVHQSLAHARGTFHPIAYFATLPLWEFLFRGSAINKTA